jgi:cullin 1
MCIMMLFNNASGCQLTVKQIKELMKMDDDTCAKNMKTLMFKNYKLLEVRGIADSSNGGKMTPGMSGLQLRDDSVIGINELFSSPLNRIVFPTPVIEEVYKKEIVQEDRSIAIEAAIVRIMKSRKKLDHLSLVQEVMQSLRMFRPNPQQIKAKIESLIDKEYLELDKDDKNIYRYLA